MLFVLDIFSNKYRLSISYLSKMFMHYLKGSLGTFYNNRIINLIPCFHIKFQYTFWNSIFLSERRTPISRHKQAAENILLMPTYPSVYPLYCIFLPICRELWSDWYFNIWLWYNNSYSDFVMKIFRTATSIYSQHRKFHDWHYNVILVICRTYLLKTING